MGYNSSAVIANCLRCLEGIGARVFVDNASKDSTVEIVEQGFPEILVVRNAKNRGFGAGVNAGLAHVKTRFLLLISPDAEVTTETLGRLYNVLDGDPAAGVAVPALEVPGRGTEMWVMGPKETGHHRARDMGDGDFCTWFASAAVALYRTSAMQRIHGFDENIFLYNEDLDLSLRLTDAGFSIIAVPGVAARHINSGSAPPSAKLHWRKDWNFSWGYLYLLTKRSGRAATVPKALKIIAARLPKALFYALVLDRKRLIRDGATLMGAIAFLMGRKPNPRD